MLLNKVGTAKISRVRKIGPCVRSPLNGSAPALLMSSGAPCVPVELDVQAFGQSQIPLEANLCKPAFTGRKSSNVGALGHEVSPLRRDRIARGEFEDFLNVRRFGNDELEERPRLRGPVRKPLGYECRGGRIARMGKLKTDVVLRDQRVEGRVWGDRPVGFDLDADVAGQKGQHPGESSALKQRLAAGHHEE